MFCFPFVPPSDHEEEDEAFSTETLARVKMHVGFAQIYGSVRDEVVSVLRERLAKCKAEGESARVYVAGHSLGGAMANLFALDLATLDLSRCSQAEHPGTSPASLQSSETGWQRSARLPPPVVYTFGAPRCGNAAFRSIYNVFVPDTFRCVASRDVIPTMPPSFVYRQLGREVWLDDAGELTFTMSWAMRQMLPARTSVTYHTLDTYDRFLRKAFKLHHGAMPDAKMRGDVV